MDIEGKKETKLANFFGISNKHLPTVRILDWKNDIPKIYSLSNDINSQTMMSFINNWKDGMINIID